MAESDLYYVKGIISDMPEADQAKVKECAEKLRAIVAEYGCYGDIALGLVGVERANG